MSASSVWVRRFATFALFLWTCLIFAGTLAAIGGFLGLSVASVESFTYDRPFNPQPKQWSVRFYITDWRVETTSEQNGLETIVLISIGSLMLGFIVGALCVSLLWHWPRWRYGFATALPALSSLILTLIYVANDEYEFIVWPCVRHVWSEAAIQCIGMLIGILLGRKIARAVVRTVIPPKPRQAFAFLWSVDAKQLPMR